MNQISEQDSKPLTLTILGGVDKDGVPDYINEIEIKRGEIMGIVGPTGSGKSTLIADIEQFALGDTPSGRKILINGSFPEARAAQRSQKEACSPAFPEHAFPGRHVCRRVPEDACQISRQRTRISPKKSFCLQIH